MGLAQYGVEWNGREWNGVGWSAVEWVGIGIEYDRMEWNTQRRGKHSFVNNGGTRDLKRNEPLRDCDLSLNLVGQREPRAVFST